ncbi:TIGR03085 family protein [Corynebacterium camporealensis]|uniref:TIGR03085 family protein n=2 Tax=Corynebacterium camporealensis TaxID=161896 RepID=A0A0F6TBG5_9CORY|nr:TIGR03085 family protein [Corynebacterium camporealensis]AVH88548.1 TIGR03085 family protein [Corynebacterium camporealensis]
MSRCKDKSLTAMCPSFAKLGHMSFSSSERSKLAQLLHDLGPDAPTLCEGWTTRDMAAHLWTRENQFVATAGVFVPALSDRAEQAHAETAQRDYDKVVDEWGRGPTGLNPWRVLDSKGNFAEHFIHHEDVRRANGQDEPRDFSRVVNKQMHSTLEKLAKAMLRKSKQPVVLYPEGFSRIVAADSNGVSENGSAVVAVHGEVGELLLWVYGRDAAHVKIEGDESQVVKSSL